MAVNSACRPNDLPYDPIKDFQPVTNFASPANVVSVNPTFPANDFTDFLDALKKNAGKYPYVSSRPCRVLPLPAYSFKISPRTAIGHVPYKGSGQCADPP